MIVTEDALNVTVNKYYNDPDVVAIFYHPGLDRGLQAKEQRMIYMLMKDEASGRRLVGM
jgi:hypothetical protein